MDLELSPRIQGRARESEIVSVLGEVTEADLQLLAAGRGLGGTPTLVQLRDRHHSVARLLAQGFKPGEVAVMTGYVASRISILQNDPCFQELLAQYRAEKSDLTSDLDQRIADTAGTALSLLQDRMEDQPDLVETGDVHKIAKDLLDRAGKGPSATKNVNVNFGLADRLEAARQRVKTIDVTPKEGPVA